MDGLCPENSKRALGLTGGGRIVGPSGETITGWRSTREKETGQQPRALLFDEALIEPSPSKTVVYGANLPAPPPNTRLQQADCPGAAGTSIAPRMERAFLQCSLAGGHIRLAKDDGEERGFALRWLCISAQVETGIVWRCFARVAGATGGLWSALPHSYVFHARTGVLLNAPDGPVAAPGGIEIRHPPGHLTSFPCRSQRVKVTVLESDGRVKRQLLELSLRPSGAVVAYFSDGTCVEIGLSAAGGVSNAWAA
jgi:hypothetical protein